MDSFSQKHVQDGSKKSGGFGRPLAKPLIEGEKGGGAIGAIIGGALNAEKNKGTTCRIETRYEEQRKTIYSHSTITFDYEGKQYTLNFKK